MIKNEKGLTLFEMLISITIGSFVIMLLMSLMTTTLVAKNRIDYENRLLQESYMISEYLQSRIFELGVRSIEALAEDDPDHQIIKVNHEFDIVTDPDTGVITVDRENQKSYILHYDAINKTLSYGPYEHFDVDTRAFDSQYNYRINSANVDVVAGTNISFQPITRTSFEEVGGEERYRTSSAIIYLNIVLEVKINDNPLFTPQSFQSTIVF